MKLQITVEGKNYEVEVEVLEEDGSALQTGFAAYQPPPAPLPPMPFPGASGSESMGDEDKVCRSPVTGLVVKVNVVPGQLVEAGEPVLVLEAMKMENNVAAPRTGTVKCVHVASGDSVKAGQILVEFE